MGAARCRVSGAGILVAALALAGCQGKDSVEAHDESVEAVAKKVAQSDIRPAPGRWEATMTIAKMEMPGLPPQAREMLTRQLGKPQTFATCLTPEEAAKPDASFFQKAGEGCKYDHFSMKGGIIDARVSCDREGARQAMTMAGSYGTEKYDVTVNSAGEAQPGVPMKLTMSIASRRVGACTGKEDR